jgi:hypothetical protein
LSRVDIGLIAQQRSDSFVIAPHRCIRQASIIGSDGGGNGV